MRLVARAWVCSFREGPAGSRLVSSFSVTRNPSSVTTGGEPHFTGVVLTKEKESQPQRRTSLPGSGSFNRWVQSVHHS